MTMLKTIAAACAVSFAAGMGVMWAQQRGPATTRETQFENDQVSVWKTTIMPKQPLTLHRHDHARTLIALTDGQLKVVDKDGKRLQTYNWAKGKAYWLDAEPPGQLHADINDTGKPIEVIVVQLKKDK